MALVFIRKSVATPANESIARYLRYDIHLDKESLFNTPPMFTIAMVGKVLKWMKARGGLEAIEREAADKAAILYRQIDESDGFYSCPVHPASRSHMNVVFRLPSEALESRFLAESKSADLLNLKGHRSVGGMPGEHLQRDAACRRRSAGRCAATARFSTTGANARLLVVLFSDDELRILPYHRVVRDLGGHTTESFLARLSESFVVETLPDGDPEGAQPRARGEFAVHVDGRWYRFRLAGDEARPQEPAAAIDAAMLQARGRRAADRHHRSAGRRAPRPCGRGRGSRPAQASLPGRLAQGVHALLGRGFPFSTLVVNVAGSLAMGVVYVVFLERSDIAPEWRSATVVGFLGAFTTFSMDTLLLIQQGDHAKAGVNVVLSVVLCLAGCWLGMVAARQF